MNIVMLLANPFRPDPRVFKEAESLSALGYSVTVICWDRTREFGEFETTLGGTQIIRVQSVQSAYGVGGKQLFRVLGFWKQVLVLLKWTSPDILHCHDFDTLPVGLFWGLRNQIPVIYDAHEHYAEMVKPRLHGFLGAFLFNLIYQSERIGARLSNAVITVDNNLAMIYRKINKRVITIGHYPLRLTAERPRKTFSGKEIRLGYTGRISTDRGMKIYVDILRELNKRNIPACLILAGVFTPSDELSIFFEYAGDISNQIEYAGWIPFDQIGEFLNQADVGLAIFHPEPRFVSATPVKLYEYMAAGLPVIASDFPLISEIVQKNNCGIVVSPSEPVHFAVNALEKWWSDWSIPTNMGENGRQAILSTYNWETLVQKIALLYKDLSLSK